MIRFQSNPEYSYTYLNLAILYKEEYSDYLESIKVYTDGLVSRSAAI